jgi:uncharacterized cupredoxin-like copper-binding protein
MRSTKSTLLAFALISTLLGSNTFAAAPAETVNVSLAGEADQPMKIDVDKTAVKAGIVQLVVTNDAIGTDHEMVLVKLASKDTVISADPKTHRIDEKKLKSMGEVAGLKAGNKGTLKVKLAPGEYALICNHKSHYELGMATRITVTN